jgi:glycosyltransferase involved in cell wall biosynthesis
MSRRLASPSLNLAPARLTGLSIFLPAHNEEANLEHVVEGLGRAAAQWALDYELIVVNDGSRDRTGEIAARLAKADSRVRSVTHTVNRGYGAAVKSGLQAARMPYVMLCDGDGQFDPADFARLVEKIGQCDVVVGRRVNRAEGLVRRLNGELWSALMRLLFGLQIRDIDCGFKLFRRDLLEGLALRADGAMISTELMAKLVARGARICEVDVRHLPRTAGEPSGAKVSVIARAFVELFILASELRAETAKQRQTGA